MFKCTQVLQLFLSPVLERTPLHRQENIFPVYLSRAGAKPTVMSGTQTNKIIHLWYTFSLLSVRKYIVPKRQGKKPFQGDIRIYHMISAKPKVTIFLFLEDASTPAHFTSLTSGCILESVLPWTLITTPPQPQYPQLTSSNICFKTFSLK